MSITVSDMSYHYFNQEPLFEHISFSVLSNSKISVIGDNGTGKTTLLKLLAGEIKPSLGSISCSSLPYYIPQRVDVKHQTIGEVLGVCEKIKALQAICNGTSEQIYYDQLADDWEVESRCRTAIEYWGLPEMELNAPIDSLSGGEKTKIFLAGLLIHKPDIILLDEPTNHLDYVSRQKLYDYIIDSKATIVVVSHDVALLNLFDITYELSKKGIKLYGGNYAFYQEQKEMEEHALELQINSEKASLRLARKKVQEVRERQVKRVNQGERNKSQIVPVLRKTMLNKGENTNARLSEKHAKIVEGNRQKLADLQQRQRSRCELKIDFDDMQLHNGKLLIEVQDINYEYIKGKLLWESPVSLEIRSGERIQLTGDNGAGKTTLINLLIGKLSPVAGKAKITNFSYIYLDQEYSQVNVPISVLDLARQYNYRDLPDHEVKLRLNRGLFPQDTWNKSCITLSGGERMRLYLCCLMISNHMPDLLILDEPTNNLDLSSLSILTDTISNYQGTLLVISHDTNFINEIGITRVINLSRF